MFSRTFIFLIGITGLGSPLAFAEIASEPAIPYLNKVLSDYSKVCVADSSRLSSNEQKQLYSFYQQNNFEPQWQSPARQQQLAEAISQLRFDGLNPERYPVPAYSSAQTLLDESELCADIRLSRSYLSALQALSNGILDPTKVEPYWIDKNTQGFQWRKDVTQLAAQHLQAPEQAMDAARPDLAVYRQLRETLQQRLAAPAENWLEVPKQSKSLRPDAIDDPRTPILRARLQELGYFVATAEPVPAAELSQPEEHELITELAAVLPEQSELEDPAAESVSAEQAESKQVEVGQVGPEQPAAPTNIYDAQLVEAVKAFQQDYYLQVDGIVGPATLKHINIPPEVRNQQIAINLERLRWINNLLEPTMLLTDIAGAGLDYHYQGKSVWESRGQVGSIARQTPLMKSRITHLTLNPTWTVPPTIYTRDKLPAIRRDIGYLARSKMTVLDMQGNTLDPYSIDWSNPGAIMLRQAAGPRNALGQVAIRFPNPFMVYLHDTPSQALFDRASRSVSSGCVRVENIQQLIDWLFKDAGKTLQDRVRQVQKSGRTQNVSLAEPIPVLLGYWTASVEEDGRLRFRNDIYNFDQDLISAWQKATGL